MCETIEDTGGKEEKSMKKKITYSDEPIRAKVIKDFLPEPEDLVMKDEKVKVTIALSKKSIEFFKTEAKRFDTNYQKMIRNLLDIYVAEYEAGKRVS
ncbi:MAG: hypothetical protein DSZ05_04060 [Sulfurospirillum sp.]|nr:MAG: hypothetical protein DSZ05_04060 [Sulfurospirillum sp.]